MTGDCAAGYYCIGGAIIPNPIDNVTGAICPEGHYCPDGTFTPESCPPGYYLNATGSGSFADCKLCLAGKARAGTKLMCMYMSNVCALYR